MTAGNGADITQASVSTQSSGTFALTSDITTGSMDNLGTLNLNTSSMTFVNDSTIGGIVQGTTASRLIFDGSSSSSGTTNVLNNVGTNFNTIDLEITGAGTTLTISNADTFDTVTVNAGASLVHNLNLTLDSIDGAGVVVGRQ